MVINTSHGGGSFPQQDLGLNIITELAGCCALSPPVSCGANVWMLLCKPWTVVMHKKTVVSTWSSETLSSAVNSISVVTTTLLSSGGVVEMSLKVRVTLPHWDI